MILIRMKLWTVSQRGRRMPNMTSSSAGTGTFDRLLLDYDLDDGKRDELLQEYGVTRGRMFASG
jgi:hypothetical protein